MIVSATAVVIPVLAEDSTPAGSTNKERAQIRVTDKKQLAQQNLDIRKQTIASKAAMLKERLQGFKNKLKATLVEKISDTLNRINSNRTAMLQKHLDKMSEIMVKLESRAKEASGSGKNTASASAAINDAKRAIASTSAAVVTQSQMDYTVSISTESAARIESKVTRDKLQTDLRSVRMLVIETKQKVANAIRSVAQTLGGIKSGQQ